MNGFIKPCLHRTPQPKSSLFAKKRVAANWMLENHPIELLIADDETALDTELPQVIITEQAVKDNLHFKTPVREHLPFSHLSTFTLRQAMNSALEKHNIHVGYAENQQLVTQLKELDRLKSQFINDVSHELRTPVTNMTLYIDLLERGNPDKQQLYVKTLRQQSGRVSDLIDKVLNLSRIDMGKIKPTWIPTDLNDVIRRIAEVYEPTSQQIGLNFVCDLDSNLPFIFGSANQIALVIDNLISNAFLYTQEGTVRIKTAASPNGTHAILSVADTGMGIKESELPHIFNRFYRGEMMSHANIPGSGLGLAIVDEIVNMHNGDIQVRSVEGKGTEFKILLPFATVPVPA